MIKRCPVLLQCNLKGSLNRLAGKSAKDWGSADLGVLDPVLKSHNSREVSANQDTSLNFSLLA